MTDDTETTDDAITALVAGRNALRDAVNAAAAAARFAHETTAAYQIIDEWHDEERDRLAEIKATGKYEPRYYDLADMKTSALRAARAHCAEAARVAADAARAVARVERAARRADDGALAYMAERAAAAAERATASAALASTALDRLERRCTEESR
jgi:hypothetical protein